MSKKILNRIEREASKLTVELEGKNYTLEELITLSRTAFNYILSSLIEPLPEILNDHYLNENELNEVKNYIKKQGAIKWKAKIRKQKKEGKLEQYQIDALNKLGMIWHPKGGGGSFDEWENNYLIFKNFGFCLDIKDWVSNQRSLNKTNTIPIENFLRLKAINFPFEEKENEEYKLTTKFIWRLRVELEEKMNDYVVTEKKKHEIVENYKVLSSHSNEEREFYYRAYNRVSYAILKLDVKEGLRHLQNISEGYSISDIMTKEFLDEESSLYKKQSKELPSYIRYYYKNIKNKKLNDNEIYSELSWFIGAKINPILRKQACIYMLKFISSQNLRQTKFSEVNYLISEFKKEKNLTELIELSLFIREYPILKELYLEKLENTILKLSSKKQKS
jgi:hypothetical protein